MTSARGQAHTEPDGRVRVVFDRTYDEPIEEVWAACTESARLARWFGSHEGATRVGDTGWLTLTAEEDATGDAWRFEVLECTPPRTLVIELPEQDGGEPWVLRLSLGEGDGVTTLRFEQLLPSGTQPSSAMIGWHWYLDRLGSALAARAMPDWNDYYPSLTAVYG